MQRRMKKRTKPKPLPPIDAEGILQVLANVRELIPHLNKEEALPPRKSVGSDERMASAFISAEAVEEFGYQAVIEGLESVAQEISEALEQKHAKLAEDCLLVYYKMEELPLNGEPDYLHPQAQDLLTPYD